MTINVKFLVQGIAMSTTTCMKNRLITHTVIWLLTAATTFAANYTSQATGNWSSVATWGGAGTPGIDDNVTITNNDTVTVNVTSACASLTFGADGNTSTLTMTDGTTLTVNGNVIFNAPTSDTRTKLWNINAATALVNGSVTLNEGTADSRVTLIVITTGTLHVAGSVSFVNTTGNARTIIDMSGGAGNLIIGGNLGSTGNYGTLTPRTTSTVTFDSTNAQSIALVGAMAINNLIVNKSSGTLTATTNIPVGGNLTITSGTFDLVTYACNRTTNGGTCTIGNGAYLRVGGNTGYTTIQNGTTYNYASNFPGNFTTYSLASSSRVEYYLNGAQEVPYDNLQYGKLILSGGGKKLARQEPVMTPYPAADSVFAVNDSLILRSGVILDVAQDVFYCLFNGVVNIEESATLEGFASGGAERMRFLGPFMNVFGTYNAPNGVFQSTFTSETVFGNTTINGRALTLYETIINGNTILNTNATATNLTVNTGMNLTTGNSDTVIVTGTRSGSGLITGSISHQHAFATGTPYFFEGPNTSIQFSSIGSSPGTITITSYPNTGIPVGDSANAIKRYYNIVTSGGSGDTATLQLHYDSTSERNNLNAATFSLWRWNGSAWEDQGGIRGGAGTADWVQQTGLTNLTLSNNYWTIAVGAGPLPVQLTSFTVSAKKFDITLEWETATEKNNYGFDIERQSTDGIWIKIGFIGGHGTTTIPQEYSYTDQNAPSGKLSYRLRQIDFDGKFEYSKAVDIVSGATSKSFMLGQNYPCPFNPITTIEFSIPDDAPTLLKVYNVLGQEVASLVDGEILSSGLIHKITFDGRNLSSGTYYYVLKSGKFSAVKKMILLK